MPRLSGQIRTNPLRGFTQLLGGNLNPLSTPCVSARIVQCTLLTPGAIERRELRRPDPPIAPLLPRHDMEMKVRRFLPAIDPVVLKREYSERPIRLDERLRDSLGRDQNSRAFLVG